MMFLDVVSNKKRRMAGLRCELLLSFVVHFILWLLDTWSVDGIYGRTCVVFIKVGLLFQLTQFERDVDEKRDPDHSKVNVENLKIEVRLQPAMRHAIGGRRCSRQRLTHVSYPEIVVAGDSYSSSQKERYREHDAEHQDGHQVHHRHELQGVDAAWKLQTLKPGTRRMRLNCSMNLDAK